MSTNGIRWIQTQANAHQCGVGPFTIKVYEVPALSALDGPRYRVAIGDIDEKLPPEINNWTLAKQTAIVFFAQIVKASLDELVKAGVVGVRRNSGNEFQRRPQ